jgi:hypothetical protein
MQYEYIHHWFAVMQLFFPDLSFLISTPVMLDPQQ